jgi:hypothetical protein
MPVLILPTRSLFHKLILVALNSRLTSAVVTVAAGAAQSLAIISVAAWAGPFAKRSSKKGN